MSALQKSPGIAKEVVMTAPLIWPKTPFPNFFVSVMAKLHCQFGFCETTAWGRQTVPIEQKTFEANISTNSRARWLASHKIGLKYRDYYVSGTSWGWLKMAMTLGSEVSNAKSPMNPGTLMLMADDDGYIDPKPSFASCLRSTGCEAVTLKGSRHEILHEVDAVRNQAIEKIIKHFRSVI
jgi:alpha-beta hydrolase superfamily lysophospholipase